MTDQQIESAVKDVERMAQALAAMRTETDKRWNLLSDQLIRINQTIQKVADALDKASRGSEEP